MDRSYSFHSFCLQNHKHAVSLIETQKGGWVKWQVISTGAKKIHLSPLNVAHNKRIITTKWLFLKFNIQVVKLSYCCPHTIMTITPFSLPWLIHSWTMSELCIPKCELPTKYHRIFKERTPTMPMNLVEVALPLPRLWVKSKLYESILINNQVTKKKSSKILQGSSKCSRTRKINKWSI